MSVLNFSSESALRIGKVRAQMAEAQLDAVLIADNANIYYTTGAMFRGYVYIPADGQPLIFVIRPIDLTGDDVVNIRKPEQITAALSERGMALPGVLGLELDDISYSDAERLRKAMGADCVCNCSALMKRARMVKTDAEIEAIRQDGLRQAAAYRQIPRVYQEEMTDIEFQIEIERLLRLEGCLGYYRTSGPLMEINMGSVLNGGNADNPTPYDFAVGGGGADTSLPVGADGRTMRPGTTVMIDMCGNFNGYQSDMTRVWRIGKISEQAVKAHEVSRDILRAIENMACPGVPVALLYDKAVEIARAAGLEEFFMGHRQKGMFIGHGVGIQLNEWPVLTPRSKDVLEKNMVIAVEPKFVIPEVGAVGVENTYQVTEGGLRCLTVFPEEIADLL